MTRDDVTGDPFYDDGGDDGDGDGGDGDGGDGDGGDGDGGDGDGGDGVGYDCRSRVPLVEGMTTGGKKHLANGDNLGNLHPGSLHTRT